MNANYYVRYHIAGFFEGIGDNLRTVLPDLQSAYHDFLTSAPRLSQPHARIGTMEITEGEKDVFKFGPPVLETDPATDIIAAQWQADQYEREGGDAPSVYVESRNEMPGPSGPSEPDMGG